MGGFFSGIKDAKPTERAAYFVPGVYRLKILACKMQESRKKEYFFIAEFEVIESSTSERPPGMRMAWMVKTTNDNFQANVRNFIAQVEGVPIDEVDEEAAEAVVDPKVNPFAGQTVRCSATLIETKAGNPFTLCQWITDDKMEAAAAS